jgi:predicted nucleic acid-binding protein
MYLLDTNVISELRKPRPHGAVLTWISSVEDADLRLSAVTIGEIQAGIEITRDQDSGKAAELEAWLEQVCQSWNIVPLDSRTFRCFAKLMYKQPAHLIEDALIAASAIVHNLTVVTRNLRDFDRFGVKLFDPFDLKP